MSYFSWPVLLFVSELLLKVLMIGVVLLQQRKTPSAKLTWILLIISIPFIGTLAYLLFGTTRLGSLRKRRHKKILQLIPQTIFAHIQDPLVKEVNFEAIHNSIAFIAESVGGSHVIGNNSSQLFGDSHLMIESLAHDIENATSSCHILSYIMLDDIAGKRIAKALERASKNGVSCKLLLDSIGSRDFLKSHTCSALRKENVEVVEALPANIIRAAFARIDIRNHRKIAVIDNTIGYLGSQNIAEPSFAPKLKFAPWVDASVRVIGPAVRELQAIFVQDWFMDNDENLSELLSESIEIKEGGFPVQLIATGPNSNNLALSQLLQTAFFNAKRELVITTPYFSPDIATESALLISAQRGVETHLVVPANNDSKLVAAACRSKYPRLLAAGVQIHEFNGGLLHSKTLTIDREFALLGSANLDRRSLELNFEVSMLVYDSDFASELRFLQTSYIEESTPVLSKNVASWSLSQRLWQNAVSLIAPIL